MGTSFFDQMDATIGSYTVAHANNMDSDDDLDDELDFEAQKKRNSSAVSSPKKKFNEKYVEKNRNQSIMRYEDIFRQSTKAVQDISDSPNVASMDEFSPQLLDL